MDKRRGVDRGILRIVQSKSEMLRSFLRIMNHYPIAAPIISAGVLSFMGDFIAQQVVERRSWKSHDWRRTLQQSCYGLIIIGPATCVWYRYLDRSISHPNIAIRTRHLHFLICIETLSRVFLDQALFTPIFLGIYFIYNALCEGSSFQAVEYKFQNGYQSALIANYKLWPAVQCINFCLVPLNYRLLFVNIIALGWCAYLSNLNSRHMLSKSL